MQEQQIISTRTIPFSREKVWEAYQTEAQIKQWWWPHGFTNTFEKFEFKEGGEWIFTMTSADGVDFLNKIIFKEITPKEKIVIEHLPPPHFMAEMVFETIGDSTKIVYTMTFDSVEQCEAIKKYAPQGNEENFDRLENLLKWL